ncbi:GNAT family N-acyltransferase [uncultured Pelagimonas sp.]|uniref:GNAT family N-acetyltransferase n=1 Tax=uncultured Pelagimonas sp. TaxID=1618102 RepID=UPI002616348C|nr:GNAT family N-acyltransferase [uncultured Pelagimonas sp.]
MAATAQGFSVRLARDAADLEAAQRLRYDVFVSELGGDGPLVDHDKQLEKDHFDPFFDHLLLLDEAKDRAVVGVYRLLRENGAKAAGQFYSEDEYDLGPLRRSGRKLLELGRSCVAPSYRGGTGLFHLWQGLADYVLAHDIEILFGTASFHGTKTAPLAQSLSLLYHRHLAPEELRVKAREYQVMDLVPEDQIDRKAAMLQIPPLIKAYLRLGGCVGDGAFVDHAFNTTDVCLVMDTAKMTDRQRGLYVKDRKE